MMKVISRFTLYHEKGCFRPATVCVRLFGIFEKSS